MPVLTELIKESVAETVEILQQEKLTKPLQILMKTTLNNDADVNKTTLLL